jgi:nuclear pore complex protein Nup85
VRALRNELEMLDDSEGRGDWREGLEDLVGVLEGRQEVVLRVCSEEAGGHGWREVLSVWGIWVQADFRRQDLP